MNTNERVHVVLENNLCRINEQLNAINYGGCGYAAVELHKALLRQSVVSNIVLVKSYYTERHVQQLLDSTPHDNINEAYMWLFANADEDGHIGQSTLNGHIAVELDGILYDTDGVLNSKPISEHITPDTMTEFLTHEPHWNGKFKSANKHIDLVIDTMATFFDSILEVNHA